MSDVVDRANDEAEFFRERALADQAARVRASEASSLCADCGERIPEERRLAVPGASRCFECQEWIERKRKQQRARR